jgi:eukaryotic-like serine/threonine-protein kinase
MAASEDPAGVTLSESDGLAVAWTAWYPSGTDLPDVPVLDLLDRLQTALAGRYAVEREVGHGGMAIVYLARDARHDRMVALKVLHDRFTERLGPERFLREIRVAARLHHPHLLPLYDSGEAGGFLYYVTPFIEGGSLRDELVAQGRLALGRALRISHQVADALDYAHRQNVVHRDVKPENILLDEGHAIVADFGVARAVTAAAETLTQTGVMVGTPAYMSPEQAGDTPIDGRCDIYALGCVLFEMLAGAPPFTGSTPIAIIAQRITGPAPTLGAVGAVVPAMVEALVARTLAQRPDDRFQTAADLARALAEAEAGQSRPTMTPPATIRVAPRVAAVAVLPFVNMSADPENEFFSDGMTEELINALTRVEGLRVASRTSAFAYKGRDVDVREIGQRLNVTAVLEGSVRRAGNRLRVTAQLIDAADGYHLWSDTYDRQLADVFEVQDELTRSIVGTLRSKLTGGRSAGGATTISGPLVVPATSSLEAYTAYLKGRFFWNMRTLDGYRSGIECFEAARALDPTFALPHTGIADCWAMLGFDYFGGVPATEGMPRAKAAAQRALELDDSLAEAHSPLGVTAMLYDWDWAEAERRFRRALELKPDYVPALLWYSHFLTVMKRHDESLATIRHAAEVEPLGMIVHQGVARSLHYAGRDEEAVEHARRLLGMDPGFVTAYETIARPLCHLGRLAEAEEYAREGVDRSGRWSLLLGALGYVRGRMGKQAEAAAILSELEQIARTRYVPRYHFALVHYGLHDPEPALRVMAESIAERSGVASWARIDPHLQWLWLDPRFQDLMRPLGFEWGRPAEVQR